MSGYTRKDAAYREAKRVGYRSRAALKLCELDRKYRLFTPGARVVDLGCWPGGWLQVASERVGTSGKVVGIDIEPTEEVAANVTILQGDVLDAATAPRVTVALGGRANLVLSDLAPKLTGVKVADTQRHLALVELVCGWSRVLLERDGRVVVKLFSSVESEATLVLKRTFRVVTKHRPPSTRKGSSEIYAIGSNLRSDAAPVT